MERSSGVLLPVFSLPSKYGIGTFGREARKFIKFLETCGVKYWQMLPLYPTSYGDSPYQSFSAFALNPYFIDLEELVNHGLLTKEDVEELNIRYTRDVDYAYIYEHKFVVLRRAFERFDRETKAYVTFKRMHKKWVKDYARFMVIKGMFNGKSWQEWPVEYRIRKKKVLAQVDEEKKDEIEFWCFLQYVVNVQYKKLRRFAKSHNVKIIGDIPIYVALDSADVWSNYSSFKLDRLRRPTGVAGVPPDYFSKTGQLWGNPLYDYEKMAKNNYKWWRERIKACTKYFDVLRIDHFRGMESYWEVPYGEETAINGEWKKGPGMGLVNAINESKGDMEIIAEDLGFLTDEVRELKNQSGWPGLAIYEFAFDSFNPGDPYLPENYTENLVAYIGTHDNDTLQGFIDEHDNLHEYMRTNLGIWHDEEIYDRMMHNLFNSKANLVLVTMQDVMKEGSEYRINTPGTASGNWTYRLSKTYNNEETRSYLTNLVREGNR